MEVNLIKRQLLKFQDFLVSKRTKCRGRQIRQRFDGACPELRVLMIRVTEEVIINYVINNHVSGWFDAYYPSLVIGCCDKRLSYLAFTLKPYCNTDRIILW